MYGPKLSLTRVNDVYRAMELALAAPADAASADKQACSADAVAVNGGDAGAAADDDGWITVGSLRAQRGAAGSSPTVPSQAEALFSMDIATVVPVSASSEPGCSLDPAAAAAAASELMDMGFEGDRVQVSVIVVVRGFSSAVRCHNSHVAFARLCDMELAHSHSLLPRPLLPRVAAEQAQLTEEWSKLRLHG